MIKYKSASSKNKEKYKPWPFLDLFKLTIQNVKFIGNKIITYFTSKGNSFITFAGNQLFITYESFRLNSTAHHSWMA